MVTMTKEKATQWIKMEEAARHFGVTYAKIRAVVKRADELGVHVKDDALDRRLKLVSLADLQRVFERE